MAFMHPPLLIAVSHDPLRVAACRQRPWDSVLARWRSLTLDSQLAGGAAAEDRRLRLVRARQLMSTHTREKLAARWETVLTGALDPQPPRPSRGAAIPVQRRHIAAAQWEIRSLIEALRAGLAGPARGAAMANLLLTDGTGPVYNPAEAHRLQRAVLFAADQLDPQTLLRVA
jgi:hypothetical protein